MRGAVRRVARDELDVDVRIAEELGTYEHLWDASDVPDVEDRHYVTNGFVVETGVPAAELEADDQHAELRAFETFPHDLHPYTEAYLRDATGVDV